MAKPTGGLAPRAVGLLGAGTALAADQFAKWLIAYPLALRERGVIELLPIFDLRWEENRGVSMRLLPADGPLGRWLLVALTGAIALVVAFWLWRERDRGNTLGLGMILGGAPGNVADRLRLGMSSTSSTCILALGGPSSSSTRPIARSRSAWRSCCFADCWPDGRDLRPRAAPKSSASPPHLHMRRMASCYLTARIVRRRR